MNIMNRKLFSMMLMAGMVCFSACSDDNDNNGGGDGGGDTTLTGEISQDMTINAGEQWTLDGVCRVKSGATLTIGAGVTITAKDDDILDYILVEQGAKIIAEGTASNPIIMTAEHQAAGAWGGLHICGRAHTNVSGGTGNSEIGGATYGGNDDNDNSGSLKYVRIEYGGYPIDTETEANGITFYGVGSGTVVENCQAYMCSDDGFEWFGGSVNVRNLISVNCSDDSFDWTEGWNGTATNLLAYQEAENTLGYDCDCLIEADNNGSDPEGATPVSFPTLQNLLLVGNGSDTQGIRLRAGTKVHIDGAIVCSKGMPLTVETTQTETSLKDGESTLQNMTISADLVSEQGIYTNADFIAGTGNNVNANLSYTLAEAIDACDWITGNWVKQ